MAINPEEWLRQAEYDMDSALCLMAGQGEGTVEMDNDGIQEIVSYFSDYLKKVGITDATVRIFGSYARGTAHEDSDVDVAIISRSFAEKGPIERAAMISGLHIDAVARFRMPFDIVTFSPSEYASEQSPIASYVREAEAFYKP